MEKHRVTCPACKGKIVFEARHLGRRVKCPQCKEPVELVAPEKKRTRQAKSSTEKPKRKKLEPKAPSKPRKPSTTAKKQKRPAAGSPDSKKRKANRKRPKPESNSDDDFDMDWLSSPAENTTPSSAWNEDDAYADDAPALPPAKKSSSKKKQASTAATASTFRPSPTASDKRSSAASESPAKSRWLIYGLFLATLIPLGVNILMSSRDDVQTRLLESLAEAAENEDAELLDEDVDSDDDLFSVLPGNRIKGALLSRKTWVHWLFAGVSGICFTILFLVLFKDSTNSLGAAVIGAVFTATIGIFLLLALQWAAMASQGVWIRGRGILALLFYVVKFIGYSYSCALQEGNGFFPSFAGFTMGVGICEEVCKIVPVIFFLQNADKNNTWQNACLVGLASGVGFGVSEGITYASSYYNGISGGEIYLVRFISCVALHAVWTGAGAILLFGAQDSVHGGDLSDLAVTLAMTLGVSIVLHGLYDTLLKQEFETGALIVGVLSVGWLIGVVEKLTQFDAEYA